MTISKRGNSYQVSVGSKEDRFRQTYKTKEEAKLAETEALLRQQTTGSALIPTFITPEVAQAKLPTLKDAHDLTWRLYWSQHRGKKTHQVFCRAIFNIWPPATPLTHITFDSILEAVEEWEEEGNSGGTVNHKVSHLSMMLKTAMDKGWIDTMPKLVRRKPNKGRIRFINEAEEQALLDACLALGFDELRDLVVLAIDTGFRRGEILGLTPRDFINGKVHLYDGETKSGRGRSVPATARVEAIMKSRRTGNRVFSYTNQSLFRAWGLVRDYMGMSGDKQFVVHMLRHTCATRLVQRNVPLPVVKEWMGHSAITTTMRYVQFAPDSLNVAKLALEQVVAPTQLRVVNG